jgi:hypothetical protein
MGLRGAVEVLGMGECALLAADPSHSVPEKVPQMGRPAFHEFLKLEGRTADSIAVRSWTGSNEVMRRSRNWVDFHRS